MKQEHQIDKNRLFALTNEPGGMHIIKQDIPGRSLMRGEFSRSKQVAGVWLHATRIWELQNGSSTFERPASLSFMFMFEGAMEFAVNGQTQCFRAQQDGALRCQTIATNRPTLFTRKIRKGAFVHKINLSIEKRWLEERIGSTADQALISTLFKDAFKITEWEVTAEVATLLKKLESSADANKLVQELELESTVLRIVSLLLADLDRFSRKASDATRNLALTQSLKPKAKSAAHGAPKAANSIKSRVDELLHEHTELSEIAARLNMSVSTLQRRFKASYGITVVNYLRQKRLEQARLRLLNEETSIEEAALQAGYNHTANFVTAFKRAFGQTPGAMLHQLNN